jgi:carboxymethylenebutenolidase
MPDITIAAPDGRFAAYLALPKQTPAPGVLVIQEIFGVNKVMRELTDGFAGKGYVAVCPDLFWRQEPGIQITDKTDAEWQKAFQLFQGFNQTKGVEDLISTLDHLRGRSECSGKVGSVGYCLGGKLAYFMATRSTADCNVSYYGVGIETVLDESAAVTKPLLMHIAEKDQFVPPAAQKQILERMAKNPRVTTHVYPGCDHAFARKGGAHWNAEAAKAANRRTDEFFQRYLRQA